MASALVTVFLITADGTRKTVKRLLGTVKGVLVTDRAALFRRRIGKAFLLQARKLFQWWYRVRDDWSRAT